jgi:hypothetical protein
MRDVRNSWRGLYPRVRSFMVLKAHPMTNDRLPKASFYFFVVLALSRFSLTVFVCG